MRGLKVRRGGRGMGGVLLGVGGLIAAIPIFATTSLALIVLERMIPEGGDELWGAGMDDPNPTGTTEGGE